MELKTEAKAINSRSLYNTIDDLFKDALTSVGIDWNNDDERTRFVDFLNSILYEFYDNGHIEQWKVVCGSKNNTAQDMIEGRFVLEAHYKQKNCLNTSKIIYTIQE